jgi:hypothetical protein
MKFLSLLLTMVASLCLSAPVWGQTVDVQKILQEVTSHPRKTWIPVGTIVATHQEYEAPRTTDEATIRGKIDEAVQQYQSSTTKAEPWAGQKAKLDAIPFNVRYRLANEWAMSSTVTVKYDNGRFYWEINVDSRQDSVKPEATLAGNDMTNQFDQIDPYGRNWNRHRVFAWDGQEYTRYSVSGSQATIDAAGKTQPTVTGPLTAGLIPWGYGRFSSASLAAAQVSARQNTSGMIDMTITHTDGVSMSLTLDSAKAYAVTQATLTNGGGSTATYTCSNYRLVAGNWVPFNIHIDRQTSSLTNRLPTSEQWIFTSVSAATPVSSSFHVPVAANSVVEYSSPVTASSALYLESNTVDTRGLLAQRLAFAAAEGLGPQNCGTAATREVLSEFGKSVPDSVWARLVGPEGRTSMYDMKRLAQSQGLFCRAVKTDLATLRNLKGAKAILHFPGRNHFVVLNGVDDRDVWLIDLSSKKFYYRQSIDFFPMDWPEGTALLLSDRPIPGQSGELSDAALAGIAGGAYYACNTLWQTNLVIPCIDDPFGTGCDGALSVYFERWICGSAASGSCVNNQGLLRLQESPCIWDPYYDCTITGDWYYYYMRACQ